MAKYNNPRRTWQYSQEFKATAVEMSLLDGVRNKDVAEKLDIHPYMLSRWRKEYREGDIVIDKRRKLTNAKKQQNELTKL
jgi:Transposase.